MTKTGSRIELERDRFLGGFLIIAAILVLFTSLAVLNLFRQVSVVSSSLWLLLVAFGIVSSLKESGARGFALSLLSGLSRRQVLRVPETGSEPKSLRVGFRLFGADLTQRVIPGEQLACVSWSSGQATDLARRDMSDWHVMIWYRHRDMAREAKETKLGFHRRPGHDLLIVGPSGPREGAEQLAASVRDFLTSNGFVIELEGPVRRAASNEEPPD